MNEPPTLWTWWNAPEEWSFGKDRMRSVLEEHRDEPKKKVSWKYYCCCCCKRDNVEEINEPLSPDGDNT